MRVGVAAFLHESNTFLSVPTTLEHFHSTSWTEGSGVRDRWAGALHEIGGLLDGLDAEGLQVVPLVATYAVPGGTVTSEAFDAIADRITSLIREAMPLDGMLIALHGATVAENYPDADGEILSRVRSVLGVDAPLIVTLDLHANISRRMAEYSDALICYRSNPHLDQRERGIEAARLMARTLRGEARPVQALESPPWVIPIDRQYTREEPASLLYASADEAMRTPGILSASVAMGFYYADVEEMGVSFLAVADRDVALARRTARQMACRAWDRRGQFESHLVAPSDAVRHAARARRTPVALFDVGDNVGGGSPGDSTVLLEELRRQGVPNYLVVLYDPGSVSRCLEAGVRNEITVEAGGKTDSLHGPPVVIHGRVRLIADGIFVEREVRHGGWGKNDQGLTAVLETAEEGTVVFTSRRMAPMSLQQILSVGCQPQAKRAIVVKGVVAPRAAYEPVCRDIVLVDTPGVTAGNPSHFTYTRRRRPLYPLETDATFSVSADT
jgi:microcystin degradation protein MlrC